jgi:hypothetical protein
LNYLYRFGKLIFSFERAEAVLEEIASIRLDWFRERLHNAALRFLEIAPQALTPSDLPVSRSLSLVACQRRIE